MSDAIYQLKEAIDHYYRMKGKCSELIKENDFLKSRIDIYINGRDQDELNQTIQRQAKEISLLEESLDLNFSFMKLQKDFLDNGIYDPDALKELIFKNEQTKQELEKLRGENENS